MTSIRANIVFILCLSSVLAPLLGCVGNQRVEKFRPKFSPHLVTEVQSPKDFLKINSVFFAPVELGSQVRTLEGGSLALDGELIAAAKQESGLEIANPNTQKSKSTAKSTAATHAQALLKTAGNYGADGLLLTTLHRYVERKGTKIGTTVPASLYFSMKLIAVEDEKVVWQANYHFRDQAISDNLFTIRDRVRNNAEFGWRTAAEALKNGFSEALRDLSTRRDRQFSTELLKYPG